MFCLFCYNTTRNMISLKVYTNWIIKAPKTARITYYRGYLCDPKLVQDSQKDNLVTLVQKRHGDFDYEYIAVRT